jgi:hypothetical protein
MNEVNYNETVVLPFLQRKYQEVVNNNLVLEANLVVEQAKNKDIAEKLTKTQQTFVQEIASKDSVILDLNNKIQFYKETAITNESYEKRIHGLNTEIQRLNKLIEEKTRLLVEKNKEKKKKQEEPEISLDGETY